MDEVRMRTRVQKWGNSLAVRIPKTFAEEVGLKDDAPIEMRLVKGGLLLEPSSTWAPTLGELLDGVSASNLHDEEDTGPPQGSEAW
jgi:antitoxin MazE